MATMYYRPYSTELVKDGELPSETAMEKVVGDHSYIVPSAASGPSHQTAAPIVKVQAPPNPLPSEAQFVVVENQMADLDRYRNAIQKMGHDILALRERIRVVEGENSLLRRDLAAYNDTSKILLDSVELDGLPKPDLISRYVALKQKLTGTVAELATYKDKVQRLQNDLIKKNQKEEDYLRMSRAHTSQQGLLQKLQEKAARVKKLEEACRQQEAVIERMEKLLPTGNRKSFQKTEKRRPMGISSYAGPDSEDVNSTLVIENQRLRREMEDMKRDPRGMPMTDDSDRLELYQMLDRAEGRIATLEHELTENARKWGREKEELVNRLREHEYGLASQVDPYYGNTAGIPPNHVVLPIIAPVNALRSQIPSPHRQTKLSQELQRGGKSYR